MVRQITLFSPIRQLFFPLYVAQRLIRSRRSPRLSAVTLISIAGVAFGVMALTVVLGITGGFQTAFQDRILGLYPHMVLFKRAGDFRNYDDILAAIRKTPGVVAASPASYDDMMMAAGVHRSGAMIKGVELSSVDQVIGVRSLITQGSLESLGETPKARIEGDRVIVEDAIVGTWLTVMIVDAANGQKPQIRVIEDDPTPPKSGHARLSVLDLRERRDPPWVTFKPVNDSHVGLQAKVHREILTLGPTGTTPYSRGVDVPAGTWEITETGEQFVLHANTMVTLLWNHTEGPPSQLMVEPARASKSTTGAMVRLVNAASAVGPLRLQTEDNERGSPRLSRHEFSSYHSVHAELPGVILGIGLAKRLHAQLGTEVTMVTPLRGIDSKMLGPHGMAPSSTRHRVTGIFESGFHDYDVRLALVNLKGAQRFLNRGRVIRWLEIRAEDVLKVADAKQKIMALLDPYDMATLTTQTNAFSGKITRFINGDVRSSHLEPSGTFVGGFRNTLQFVNLLKYQETGLGHRPRYRLVDWQEMNANLFSALKLQRVVLTIFFMIIIIVGSLVVVGSQIMVIHEKTPDIAILKTMGATPNTIRTTFTLQGLFVTGLGTIIGLLFGIGVCALLGWVNYQLDASVYLIGQLPVQLSAFDLLLVACATGSCTLVATQYSASRAAAKTPVDGLRGID